MMQKRGEMESDAGRVVTMRIIMLIITYIAEAVSDTQLERLLAKAEDAARNCKDISCVLTVGRLAEAAGVIAGSLKRQEDGMPGKQVPTQLQLLSTGTSGRISCPCGLHNATPKCAMEGIGCTWSTSTG